MSEQQSPLTARGTDPLLHAALEEAYAHKSALYGLYEQLRAAGHAYASHAAYEASEAAYQLVVQLSKDLDQAPLSVSSVRPDEEPTT
jgi:hypothetical protein